MAPRHERVCHLFQEGLVGTIVAPARCAGAVLVRWDGRTGCSVVCRTALATEGSPQTVGTLAKRRRDLERQLATIDRELLGLCPMQTRAGMLHTCRLAVAAALEDARCRIAAMRSDRERPRAPIPSRQR